MAGAFGNSSMSVTTPSRFIHTGDNRVCEVRSNGMLQENHYIGSMPRLGPRHQQVAISGYTGHIAGKVSENLHGGTFRQENMRATQNSLSSTTPAAWRSRSEPQLSMGGSMREPGFASRVPGYMGTIPGKLTELVHGVRFAEASEVAKSLREREPRVACDTWMRRGVWPADRMPTYKWSNRFQSTDAQSLFTGDEEVEAKEANRQLGHIFGLTPPKGNPYKPGDRYMHSKCKRKPAGPKTRVEDMEPAGQPSYSAKLDSERWKLHNALLIANGNQRAPR